MEKNRSVLFRVLGSVLVIGIAAAVLFGLTGILRDPSVEVATQAEQQKQQPVVTVMPPPAPAALMPSDGGAETVAKVESEPFPDFDEEPTGS